MNKNPETSEDAADKLVKKSAARPARPTRRRRRSELFWRVCVARKVSRGYVAARASLTACITLGRRNSLRLESVVFPGALATAVKMKHAQ